MYPPTPTFSINGISGFKWLELKILVSTGSGPLGTGFEYCFDTGSNSTYARFKIAKTDIHTEGWNSFDYVLDNNLFSGSTIIPNPFYFTIRGIAFGFNGKNASGSCLCDYLYWYKSVTGSSTGSS
jgi:hypothetical protein